MGFVFKLLHLPRGDQMLILGVIPVTITFVFYLFNRSRFHRLIITSAVVILGIGILMYFGSNVVSRAYDHYTLNSDKLNRIEELVSNSYSLTRTKMNNIDSKEFATELQSNFNNAKSYSEEFDSSIPWTIDRRRVVHNYVEFAVYIFANKKDEKSYETGYQVAYHTNLLGSASGFENSVFTNPWIDGPSFVPWLEPYFLIKLGRRADAKSAISRIESKLKFGKDVVMKEARELFPELY